MRQLSSQWLCRTHEEESKIILILLTSGEVHIEDLRRDQKSRYELLEVQDDSDEEASAQRARYRYLHHIIYYHSELGWKVGLYRGAVRSVGQTRLSGHVAWAYPRIQHSHKDGQWQQP